MDLRYFEDFEKCLQDECACFRKMRQLDAGDMFRRAQTRAYMIEPTEIKGCYCYPIPPISVLFAGALLCTLREHGIDCSLTICEPEEKNEKYASLAVNCTQFFIRVRHDKWRIIAIDKPLDFTWDETSCMAGLLRLFLLFNEGFY